MVRTPRDRLSSTSWMSNSTATTSFAYCAKDKAKVPSPEPKSYTTLPLIISAISSAACIGVGSLGEKYLMPLIAYFVPRKFLGPLTHIFSVAHRGLQLSDHNINPLVLQLFILKPKVKLIWLTPIILSLF